jgi:uncharacterized repeat protein (TIGR03943 family)
VDIYQNIPGLDRPALRTTPQMWLKTALLLGLGIYFIVVIVTGNLTNYINERFAWLSYVAAGIFLLLGTHSLYMALRPEDAVGKDRGLSWGTLWMVGIPLLLGTLVPSRPLGVESVDRISTTAAINAAGSNVSQFEIDPLNRNVLDWLRVFNSVSDFDEVNGQPADLIGFVYSEPTFPEDQFMIARFTVSCCVADASAIGVPAYYAETPTLTQGQWVRVQGAYQVGEFRGDVLPVLQVASIEVVEQPEHPYLYP